MTHEALPLATIFDEVLSFLALREDAVVFGAHAVNAYCEPARMTAAIDVLSTDTAKLSDDLRALLSGRFGIAVRVREVKEGGFRVYQLRKPKNRHLVDVRQVRSCRPFGESRTSGSSSPQNSPRSKPLPSPHAAVTKRRSPTGSISIASFALP